MNEIKITRQEIISLCRLCLAKDLASIDIFEDGNELRHLYTKIVACLPVQIFSSDTLPHKICEVCNAKVDDFYQFWTSTARNQKQLNDWLQVATDQKVDHDGTSAPRIKVEVEEQNDYDDDYDDGAHAEDSDDEEDEASAPKRIKTAHSDEEEEDTKPTHLVADSDVNGKRKSKEHKLTDVADVRSRFPDSEDRKFQCDICGKGYKTRLSIKLHMQFKHLKLKRPFKCDTCGDRFSRKNELKEHNRDDHGVEVEPQKEKRYMPMYADGISEDVYKKVVSTNSKVCPLCQKTFKSPRNMRRHLQDQHRPQLKIESMADMHFPVERTCGTCGLVHENLTELRKHMRTVHPDVIYHPCYYCDTCLPNKYKKYRHNAEVHNGLPFIPTFTCPICNKFIKSKEVYDDHMSSHEGLKRHICKICDAKFRNYFQLKNHRSIHFPAPKKIYTCGKCNMEFSSRGSYCYHKYKVHDKKNWQCPTCGKVLASYDINHLRIHEKEMKYVCETCGKRFNCPQYLSDHRLAHHSSVKPYKCNFCDKRFTQRTPRSIHTRKYHTGETRYECHTCNVRFVTKVMLTKHILTH